MVNISHNFSMDDELLDDIPYMEEVISGVLMTLAIIVTVVGNILVILAVCKHNTQKSLHAPQNYFLVSLAFADLTVGVFVMPLSASYYIRGYWAHSYLICDMWRTLDVCLCTASILNLCAIALDRYWAITEPVKYAPKRTKKRICLIIAFVWILSCLISVPPLLGWDEAANSQHPNCILSQQQAYIILSASTSFFIPFFVMMIVYFRIFQAVRIRGRRVRRHTPLYQLDLDRNSSDRSKQDSDKEKKGKYQIPEQKTANGGSPNMLCVIMPDQPSDIPSEMEMAVRKVRKQHKKINMKKERRAARTLGIILGAFTLCWLPFFLMYLILPFCIFCQHPGRRVEAVITWIGYVNSACNPIVYTIFNYDFRNAFYDLLFGKCVRYRRKRCLEKKLRMTKGLST